MRKKPYFALKLLIGAFIAATLSGCSFNFSADTLITPPKLSDEQRAIYDALISSAGKVDLKYPRTGDYRSAFVINDIDADGENEAMVFFEPRDSSQTTGKDEDSVGNLRLGFLDKDESGVWHSVFDLPAQGTDIESVCFSPLGGPNEKELLLVSYTTLNSSDKQLSVISYSDGRAEEIARLTYTRMLISSFSDKEQQELMLFAKKTVEEKQVAEFSSYGYGGSDSFGQLYNTVTLDTEISAYDNVAMGKWKLMNDEESDCLLIDYSAPDGIYYTDIIYFTGKKFLPASKYIKTDKKLTFSRKINSYTPAVGSADINGDGISDIPVTQPLPCYESLTIPEQINAVIWYDLSYTGEERIAYTFINPGKNYILFFPERWVGRVTAKVSFADSTVSFWKVEEDGELIQQLLSIKKVDTTAANPVYTDETAQGEGYREIAQTDTYKLYVKNDGTYELSLTDDELEAAFRLLSDTLAG